jgi:hypothetical protein
VIRAVLLVSALALLTACESQHWEHPQTGTAKVEADTRECSETARREAWRYTGPGTLGGPAFARGPDGRVFVDPSPSRLYPSPSVEEAQLREYCMRSKGYRLAPDKQ